MRAISLLFLVFVSSGIARAQCTPVPNQTPAKLSCVAESPLVTGGSGTDWGKWFEITSAAVPEGYSIVSVSFRLEGPHPCAADATYPLPTPAVAPIPKSKPTPQAQGTPLSKKIAEILGSLSFPTTLVGVVPEGVGSWAQCGELNGSKSLVTWRFRFQGWTAEDRKIAVQKNSDVDQSCKEKDKTSEKEQYCNQTSAHFIWTNKNEAIRQKAKLLTIAVQP